MQRSRDHRCSDRRALRALQKLLEEQGEVILLQRDQFGVQSHLLLDAMALADRRGERIAELERVVEAQSDELVKRAALLAEITRRCEEHARVMEAQAKTIATQSVQIEELSGKLTAVTSALQALERRVLGPKSEKMPTPQNELRHRATPEEAEARRLAALERRRQRAALKQKLGQQTVIHPVRDEDKACPKCGGVATSPVGTGKSTTVYEYVPGHFAKQEHVQEKLACRCGEYIATAPPPQRALDKSPYGAGFIAHLIVMKCADSIPFYRLAKQFQRLGIPMARSTLNGLFHAAANKLEGLYRRLLLLIASQAIVQADETSLVMQHPHKRGFVWTFLAGQLIAYRFAADRSGQTPRDVLGGTEGTLVVDGYTGYNSVTDVDGRLRAGCIAHYLEPRVILSTSPLVVGA